MGTVGERRDGEMWSDGRRREGKVTERCAQQQPH